MSKPETVFTAIAAVVAEEDERLDDDIDKYDRAAPLVKDCLAEWRMELSVVEVATWLLLYQQQWIAKRGSGNRADRRRQATMTPRSRDPKGETSMTKITDSRDPAKLERLLQRLHQPDGRCYHCEQPADHLPEVGPLVLTLTMPNNLEPGERETAVYEFCC